MLNNTSTDEKRTWGNRNLALREGGGEYHWRNMWVTTKFRETETKKLIVNITISRHIMKHQVLVKYDTHRVRTERIGHRDPMKQKIHKCLRTVERQKIYRKLFLGWKRYFKWIEKVYINLQTVTRNYIYIIWKALRHKFLIEKIIPM